MRLVLTKSRLLIAFTFIFLPAGVYPVLGADPENAANAVNPHDALVLIEEGDRHFNADNLNDAISIYRKAVHAAPLNSTAHERLARALSLSGALNEAEQEAQQAVTLDGKNALAHAWYGWVLGRQR